MIWFRTFQTLQEANYLLLLGEWGRVRARVSHLNESESTCGQRLGPVHLCILHLSHRAQPPSYTGCFSVLQIHHVKSHLHGTALAIVLEHLSSRSSHGQLLLVIQDHYSPGAPPRWYTPTPSAGTLLHHHHRSPGEPSGFLEIISVLYCIIQKWPQQYFLSHMLF